MNAKLTKIRRYRFDKETAEQLESLKYHCINESAFVRQAIKAQLRRVLPRIESENVKEKLPF
jgi:hypothetical protein